MKYKIAYVDENDGWLNTFYQTFKHDFEVVKIKVDTDSTITSIIEKVFEEEVDCVITDYLLEEEGDVDFNGDKIVEAIREKKPYFPITMLTSYQPQAISNTEDVHIINGKSDLDGESEEDLEILKAKIKSSIESYYKKIERTEKKIEALVQKKNENSLEVKEEEELTKLFILMDELEPEGKDMPANLIQPEAITKLNDFVNQTREILEELKKKNK
jgi:DNA-binding NarL/FixJ family response regulator